MLQLPPANLLDVNLMLALSLHGTVILSRRIDGIYRIHHAQNYAHGNLERLVDIFRIYPPIAVYAHSVGHTKTACIKWLLRIHTYYYDIIIGTVFQAIEPKLSSAFERLLFWHVRALKYQLQIKIGWLITYLIAIQYLMRIIATNKGTHTHKQTQGDIS